MRKRVLQFIGSFHQGGTEKQAVSLANSLAEDGRFEILVATLNKTGVLLPELRASSPDDIREFPLTSFFNANFVTQVRRCASFIKENEIDLVHTHDFYTNVFGTAAAALAGNVRRVTSKRETGGMRSRAQDAVEKLAFLNSDAIVVNADAVRQHLVDRSISPNKIKVIYNGLDISRFAERKTGVEPAQSPNVRRTVTIVANLRHAVKNIPMFLSAARSVAAVIEDVDFVIAGEGELKAELEAMAAELGIGDRTHFIGRCEDVPVLLSQASVCVLSSTAEGFSNSILEYMAASSPVVATNVGGAAEAVVEGETGYLVESGDAIAMADRIVTLLKDPQKAGKMGLQGRARVEREFSLDARLSQTTKLYESLLQNQR